jgi:hypothetical protein
VAVVALGIIVISKMIHSEIVTSLCKKTKIQEIIHADDN